MMKVKLTERQIRLIIQEQSEPGIIDRMIKLGKDVYHKFTGSLNKGKATVIPVPFTPENLGAEMKRIGVKYPDIAIAQSMLETGHFKSGIFLDNNNLFGMKDPKVRPTLSMGENRGHAKFKTWQDSVKDYKMWQDFNKVNQLSKDEFLKKLNRIYCIPPECGQSNYAKKIKSLLGRASDLLT